MSLSDNAPNNARIAPQAAVGATIWQALRLMLTRRLANTDPASAFYQLNRV